MPRNATYIHFFPEPWPRAHLGLTITCTTSHEELLGNTPPSYAQEAGSNTEFQQLPQQIQFHVQERAIQETVFALCEHIATRCAPHQRGEGPVRLTSFSG